MKPWHALIQQVFVECLLWANTYKLHGKNKVRIKQSPSVWNSVAHTLVDSLLEKILIPSLGGLCSIFELSKPLSFIPTPFIMASLRKPSRSTIGDNFEASIFKTNLTHIMLIIILRVHILTFQLDWKVFKNKNSISHVLNWPSAIQEIRGYLFEEWENRHFKC